MLAEVHVTFGEKYSTLKIEGLETVSFRDEKEILKQLEPVCAKCRLCLGAGAITRLGNIYTIEGDRIDNKDCKLPDNPYAI